MESIINNFENFTDEHSDFIMQADYFPGPGENEDDDENKDNDDNTTQSGDDNPPLDEEVVHSPLTTQPGKP